MPKLHGRLDEAISPALGSCAPKTALRAPGDPKSAAILVYLAKKSGCLIPGDRAGEAPVLRWCFAAMNSVEPPLLALIVLDWTAEDSCRKHREFLVGWVNRVLTNLDRWLTDRDFVATKEFTVADILMAHVLLSGVKDQGLIASYPGLASYRDRCMAWPAWKRTMCAGRGGVDRPGRRRVRRMSGVVLLEAARESTPLPQSKSTKIVRT